MSIVLVIRIFQRNRYTGALYCTCIHQLDLIQLSAGFN